VTQGGEVMIPYGERLVALRGEKSQSEVAKAIGIATSTLGMYETEQRIPRDSIKIALANYYKTTVQEIFFTPKCHEKGQNKLKK
jgi:DNA-binding XRE family transcriptional regulator